MDIKEIQTFLTTNKDSDDVKNFVKSFYTPEQLNPFLDSDEGVKIIQPRLDRHHTKGLESWKINNLQKLIDDAVAKAHPAESEEQKRMRTLEAKIKAQEDETTRVKLQNFASGKLSEHKIPVKLAAFVVGKDEINTLQNISELKAEWDSELEKRVDEIFKLNGRQRPGPKDKKTPGTKMNDFIRTAAGRN